MRKVTTGTDPNALDGAWSGVCGAALLVLVLAIESETAHSAPLGSGVSTIIAQAGEPDARSAPAPPGDDALNPEEKRKTRSAVVLLTVVAGIALSGLLLLIVAVSVRGLQRKLGGPVQFDREPEDLLPDVASPAADEQRPDEQPDDADGATDETQHT